MKDFPPIHDIKLTSDIINKVKSHFKWSSFTVGESVVSVTPSGGVHYTGSRTLYPSISFEIIRKVYIMVSLFEYPKGIIIHFHIYYPQIKNLSESELQVVTTKLYSEIKNLLTN